MDSDSFLKIIHFNYPIKNTLNNNIDTWMTIWTCFQYLLQKRTVSFRATIKHLNWILIEGSWYIILGVWLQLWQLVQNFAERFTKTFHSLKFVLLFITTGRCAMCLSIVLMKLTLKKTVSKTVTLSMCIGGCLDRLSVILTQSFC